MPSPNPSYPQEIEVVTGEQEVVVRGKNLFNENELEIGSIDATTGQNSANPTEFRTSGYIEVNGSVALSNYNYLDYTYRGIFEYDSNKNYIKRTNDQVVSKTTPFTLNLASNTRYIRIRYIVGSEITTIPTNMQIQLEQGSATPYEPYITPITKQLSLGEYEFAKIGNYVDTIEYDVENDKVYKNGAIRKVVFTGASSEDWIRNSYDETYYRYTIVQSDIISATNTDNTLINAYSNYFGGTTAYKVINTHANNMVGVISSNRIAISTSDSNLFEVNNFKTWLSTHNTKVYYVLATPTKTEITGTLKDQIKALYYSQSFTGTTIIEINGNLPMIIKCRALKGE